MPWKIRQAWSVLMSWHQQRIFFWGTWSLSAPQAESANWTDLTPGAHHDQQVLLQEGVAGMRGPIMTHFGPFLWFESQSLMVAGCSSKGIRPSVQSSVWRWMDVLCCVATRSEFTWKFEDTIIPSITSFQDLYPEICTYGCWVLQIVEIEIVVVCLKHVETIINNCREASWQYWFQGLPSINHDRN